MGILDGKSIVVTGAGTGIGAATSARVASEGGRVALVGRREQVLRETAATIGKNSPEAEVLVLPADVADPAAVEHVITAAHAAFGRIDGLFNNAGMEGPLVLTHQYPPDDFRRVLEVNLLGAFTAMRLVLPVMLDQGSGAIVNTASVGGTRGYTSRAAYVASKHALIGLTRTAGIEYARYGITVNAIAPGGVMTPMVEESLKSVTDRWEDMAREVGDQHIPAGHFASPEEVASLATFMLSGQTPSLCGSVIVIDGGQSVRFI